MSIASVRLAREDQAGAVGCAKFQIRGDPSPQLLLRIFGLLAQQDQMPQRASVEIVDGAMEVGMATCALTGHQAEVIAEKIRSMVGSYSVQLDWQAALPNPSKPNRRMFRFAFDLRANRAAIASILRRRST